MNEPQTPRDRRMRTIALTEAGHRIAEGLLSGELAYDAPYNPTRRKARTSPEPS